MALPYPQPAVPGLLPAAWKACVSLMPKITRPICRKPYVSFLSGLIVFFCRKPYVSSVLKSTRSSAGNRSSGGYINRSRRFYMTVRMMQGHI